MHNRRFKNRILVNFGLISCILLQLMIGTGCQQNDPEIKIENGMVWVPGGEFIQGSEGAEAYSHEQPAHRVTVDGFWMDQAEVTNAQFKAFIDSTGYVTLAEKAPDWGTLKKQLPPGTPKPPDSLLVAGSLVFVAPDRPVGLGDISQWWLWTTGADWQHPLGPDSNLEEKWEHPVVHIAWEDAAAYCKWAGKRLPTEAEWEYASLGGESSENRDWQNAVFRDRQYVANTFQGDFPHRNSIEDGHFGSAPVKSFPPNQYGLYDMIGNIWEWTADWYNINYYTQIAGQENLRNPAGPQKPFDPAEPLIPKRVSKGGSFLCSPTYCANYRSTARQGTAIDTGMSNLGFRCVKD